LQATSQSFTALTPERKGIKRRGAAAASITGKSVGTGAREGEGGLPRNQRHACAQVSDICKIVPVDRNIAAATEVIVSR
jgi:hypothetical protein